MISGDVIQAVANVGFPVMVTLYLLTRVEGKLETLTTSINDLARNISRLDR